MRIFVSGGTGMVGKRAVRALVESGHDVTALVRSEEKARQVEALGARPARVGLFDRPALEAAIAGHEAVVNLATSIPLGSRALRAGAWAANDRIRTEGSRVLVDAALAAGASRFVQESITFLYADGGDSWLDEDAPVEPTAITRSALDAESNAMRFTAAGRVGVVLRFGGFYGPDSSHTIDMFRLARLGVDLLPGADGAFFPWVALDDAAWAVVAALAAPAGIFNVVGDQPATRQALDRALAAAVGARRVRRPLLVQIAGGRWNPHVGRSQRVSNRRFREATGWEPTFGTVEQGLPAALAASPVEPLPQEARRLRVLLGALGAAGLFVGTWAQFAPRSFYASFPGAGRTWVSVDGPFNEHLIRDVGGLNLALGLLAVAAALSLRRGLVRTAGAAWLVYGLPHLAYHAAHLAPLRPPDRVANVAVLAFVVVAGFVALRTAGAPAAAPGSEPAPAARPQAGLQGAGRTAGA